jgi:hypothetical protein
MEQGNLKWREAAEAFQTEQMLPSRYGRLLQWATVLLGNTEGGKRIVAQTR